MPSSFLIGSEPLLLGPRRSLRLASKIGIGAAVAAIAAIGIAEFVWDHASDATDVQKLARSLQIIRTSTAATRKVLKVLFYGQSITRSGWAEKVVEHWHDAYPNTVFVVQNRAIGGFDSRDLARTTEQDITAFYPDLIIFHAYGDHRTYEEIIRLFRSRTAADIIVQTDHGEVLPQTHCTEGLHFTLTPPPGCAGFLWYRQALWGDEMAYHKIPALARKYQLALEPQRDWWRDYLLKTKTDPRSLLIDGLHPNARGTELMAMFFNRYFDGLVSAYTNETARDVKAAKLSENEAHSGQATILFRGTRLELVASKPFESWPEIRIDGRFPKDLSGCYHLSRVTSTGTVPDWPAVRRISMEEDHVAEKWTAVLSNFSPDQRDFQFSIEGSRTGPDGIGSGAHDFSSKSGRVAIESRDWMVERAWKQSHVTLRQPIVINWSVDCVCDGRPEVTDRGDGTREFRYVVADGLVKARHSAQFRGTAADLETIDYLNVYKPRLQD
jgi:hypothetical protein